MWQLVAVAAAATSGFLAKLFLDAAFPPRPPRSHSASQQQIINSDEHSPCKLNPFEPSILDSDAVASSSLSINFEKLKIDESAAGNNGEEVFRFSSTSSKKGTKFAAHRRSQKRDRAKIVVKRKKRVGKGGLKLNPSNESSNDPLVHEGSAFLNWGMGMGIMLMASVGKSEMGRLSVALDETGKLVHELKNDLHMRKSRRKSNDSNLGTDCHEPQDTAKWMKNVKDLKEVGRRDSDNVDASSPVRSSSETDECGSSVITEESMQQSGEFEELEAELQSELEKISGNKSDGIRIQNDSNEMDPKKIDACYAVSVSPHELNRKLHDLVEQKEGENHEMKAKLQSTEPSYSHGRLPLL